jgi:hypothetical protein
MHAGVDSLTSMFALRNLLSEGGAPSVYGEHMGQSVSGLPDWNMAHRSQRITDTPPAVTHDFHCAVPLPPNLLSRPRPRMRISRLHFSLANTRECFQAGADA